MSYAIDDLWNLVDDNPRIDTMTLALAIERAAAMANDFRSRLVIRDGILAIRNLWGDDKFERWLATSAQRDTIEAICQNATLNAFDERGFPSLKRRIADATKPENVLALFRELSTKVESPTRLLVGGAIPLILSAYLQRATEGIDIVEEVPANLRTQYQLLQELEDQYGLQFTHFQSHYLPAGWEQRLQSVGQFGMLEVLAVEGYDAFIAKLFSSRRKDKEDLRAILPHLDRQIIRKRLAATTSAFLADAKLRATAGQNWYILFGEELPS